MPRTPVVIDDFLSSPELSEILEELEICYWQPSSVMQRCGQRETVSVQEHYRLSQTAQQQWFSAALNRILKRIERRLAKQLNVAVQNCEPWQATRYEVGSFFHYHVDCGVGFDKPGGERLRTIVIYLDTPIRGGETHFRALDKTVKAVAGRLLVWNNLLPSGGCDHAMVHSGLPLKQGAKTTLVTWQRVSPIRKEAGK